MANELDDIAGSSSRTDIQSQKTTPNRAVDAVQLRYLERYGSSSSLRSLGGNGGGGRNGGTIIRVDGAGVVQVCERCTRRVSRYL